LENYELLRADDDHGQNIHQSIFLGQMEAMINYILAFYRRILFTDNCILIQGIEKATAVLFLSRLLREKGRSTDFIKICTVWLMPCIIKIYM